MLRYILRAFGTQFAVTGFMKTNIVPPKFTLLFGAAFAVMLAFAQNASAIRQPMPADIALDFNDSHVVGTVTPGAPANPASVAQYINFMITLSLGQSVSHDFGQPQGIQTVSRSNNTFGSLPNASATGAVSGTGTTIDLGSGGFSYLFAKYDGQNDLSFVWNVADLTGIIGIPQLGPLGHGLSGWILYGGGQGVPDGGTTVMLLGAALGSLGVARRFLKA